MPFKSEIVPSAFRRPAPDAATMGDVAASSPNAPISDPMFPMSRMLPAVSQELIVALPRNRYFSQLLHHFVQQQYDEMNLDLESYRLDLEMLFQGRTCRVVIWLDESSDGAATHALFGIVKPFLSDCADDPAFFTRLLNQMNAQMCAAVDCDPKAPSGLSMQALDDLFL